MPDKRALGREAEDRAARYLLEQGYTLVTRRFSSKGGEIDLVALDGETMVFVEVKARSGKFGTPEEAILLGRDILSLPDGRARSDDPVRSGRDRSPGLAPLSRLLSHGFLGPASGIVPRACHNKHSICRIV